MRETVRRVVDLAGDLNAKVIVRKFSLKSKDRMESVKDNKLKRRIHQCNAIRFLNMLNSQPIEV